MKQRRIDNTKGIFLIWLSWAIGTGALVLLIVLSLWVKPEFMPVLALALDFVLFTLIRRNRTKRLPTCLLIPFICSRTLLWSAAVMAVINLLYSHWIITYFYSADSLNMQIPFITQLILAPVLLAVSLWARWKKQRLGFCRDCYLRHGTPSERGFLGKLANQEGRYQLNLLIIIALICTIGSYGYYLLCYVNESLTKTDKFFFVWNTVAFFGATTVYTAFRYLGLWGYYCKKEENLARTRVTMTRVRYIVFNGDHICIAEPGDRLNHLLDEENKPDVPVQISLTYRTKVTLFEAVELFRKNTGINDPDIRLMYETTDNNADNNIFHYLCFLTDTQKDTLNQCCGNLTWPTLNELAMMINSGKIDSLLAAEFIRLHSIAMAWKTYNPDGTRKYKIKHYKPTFRLRDIKDYNVDFSNTGWLYIADNNADNPFFKLKRFWRHYINRIF